jgi:hypothetical protein
MTMASTLAIPLAFMQPATANANAIAQRFPDNWRNSIQSGTLIPTRYEKEQIIVTPNETAPLTLTVDRDITNGRGTVIIPEGSQIEGELRPEGDGTQFVAQRLVIEGDDIETEIDATSDIITRRETISRRSDPRILEGAAIGGAAAAVLAEIFGRIDLWEVLGGAGLGALASVLIRNRNEVEVITIDPATDLTLTLDSDFALQTAFQERS